MNIKDFLDFVDFIKNVDKYEARVQTLKDENDRLEANIRYTSEVAEIANTKEVVAKLLSQAQKELDDAKLTAVEVKEKAKVVYDKRLAEVALRETATSEAQTLATATLKKAEDLNVILNASLVKQLSSLETKEVALDEKMLEVSARLAKLKSVME